MATRKRSRSSESDDDSVNSDSSSSSDSSDDDDTSDGSVSSSSEDERRSKKSKKKHKKKEKKRKKEEKKKKKKKKKKQKKKKEKKKRKEKQERDESERQGQAKVDAIDSATAAAMLGTSRGEEKEQISLLQVPTDLASRAAALNLPKGLIRESSSQSGSGLFSNSGKFGDRASRQSLRGLGGGDSNPATQARLKREHQAQRAEKRARQILEERRKASQGADGDGGGGGGGGGSSSLALLKSRFSGGSFQK